MASCEPVCSFVLNGSGDYEISAYHINKCVYLRDHTILCELGRLQTFCDRARPPIALVYNDAGGRSREDHTNTITNMSLQIHLNIGMVLTSGGGGPSKGSLTATGDIAFIIRWAGKDMRMAGWSPTTRAGKWTWTLPAETIDNPAFGYKGSMLQALDCLEQDILQMATTASIAWQYQALNYGEPPAAIPVGSFRLPVVGHGRYDEYVAASLAAAAQPAQNEPPVQPQEEDDDHQNDAEVLAAVDDAADAVAEAADEAGHTSEDE